MQKETYLRKLLTKERQEAQALLTLCKQDQEHLRKQAKTLLQTLRTQLEISEKEKSELRCYQQESYKHLEGSRIVIQRCVNVLHESLDNPPHAKYSHMEALYVDTKKLLVELGHFVETHTHTHTHSHTHTTSPVSSYALMPYTSSTPPQTPVSTVSDVTQLVLSDVKDGVGVHTHTSHTHTDESPYILNDAILDSILDHTHTHGYEHGDGDGLVFKLGSDDTVYDGVLPSHSHTQPHATFDVKRPPSMDSVRGEGEGR
ncbi:hypothetical protein EON63_06600, partial [archaeon]